MTSFSSPVPKGARYTSAYGRRWGTLHAGDDYAPVKPGDHDPIYAAADGTVEAVGTGILKGHTGQIVIIDHGMLTGNGSTDHTKTNYGHCSKIVVKRGQKVKAGQLIAYMGATGNVTGVHAHCGVRFNGKFSSFHKWMKSKGITPGETAPRKPSGSGSSSSSKYVTVKRGSKNSTVGRVQRELRSEGYTKQIVDNDFGAQTEANVRDFQRRTGLVQDGIAGPITQKRLGI